MDSLPLEIIDHILFFFKKDIDIIPVMNGDINKSKKSNPHIY